MTQTTGTFTRMDESTAEQWGVIVQETFAHQDRVAESVLGMLRSLAGITDGFAVDQLTHSLQTATLAERAGADDELVVAALCHDIGKAVSVPNHPRISAEILRPYVRDEVHWMIQVHQDFQGRHYYAHLGADPNARDQHVGHECVRARRALRRRVGPDARSIPTTTRSRSSTSRTACARSSGRPSRSERAVGAVPRRLVARAVHRRPPRRPRVRRRRADRPLDRRGQGVAYLLVTRGEAGIDGMTPDEAGPLREAEERGERGGRRRRDGRVPRRSRRRRRRVRAVACGATWPRRSAATGPTSCVSMNYRETWGGLSFNMADHRHVGLATLDAARDAGNRWIFSDAGEPGPACAASRSVGRRCPRTSSTSATRSSSASPACGSTPPTSPASATTSTPTRSCAASRATAGEQVGCEYAAIFELYEL